MNNAKILIILLFSYTCISAQSSSTNFEATPFLQSFHRNRGSQQCKNLWSTDTQEWTGSEKFEMLLNNDFDISTICLSTWDATTEMWELYIKSASLYLMQVMQYQ